jgi:hypothetical protein
MQRSGCPEPHLGAKAKAKSGTHQGEEREAITER